MADQRIKYNEEMVGANHPMKGDTLNRLKLVDHDSSGFHRSTAFPSFFAHLGGTNISQTSGYTVIPFGASTARRSFDNASGFDSSGYYVVPKTGKWFLSVNVYSCNISTLAGTELVLVTKTTVNDSASALFFADQTGNASTAARSFFAHDVVPLTAGDRVYIQTNFSAAAVVVGSSVASWFCGAFMGK
jgi:hypothetical protein